MRAQSRYLISIKGIHYAVYGKDLAGAKAAAWRRHRQGRVKPVYDPALVDPALITGKPDELYAMYVHDNKVIFEPAKAGPIGTGPIDARYSDAS